MVFLCALVVSLVVAFSAKPVHLSIGPQNSLTVPRVEKLAASPSARDVEHAVEPSVANINSEWNFNMERGAHDTLLRSLTMPH